MPIIRKALVTLADGTQAGRGTAKKMHIESQLLTQISFQLQVHVMQKSLKSWFFKGEGRYLSDTSLDQGQVKPRSF